MDAIHNALEAIGQAVNTHLQGLNPRGDDWIVLTSLVGLDGGPNAAARDTIVMAVWGIAPQASGAAARDAPPLRVDVRLIFVANFAEAQYPQGLAALSRLMAYFHQNPVFDGANAPGLDPSLGLLAMDAVDLDAQDTRAVLGMLGAHYFPSAFYTLRGIPVAS
jgi:hypothetical protein